MIVFYEAQRAGLLNVSGNRLYKKIIIALIGIAAQVIPIYL